MNYLDLANQLLNGPELSDKLHWEKVDTTPLKSDISIPVDPGRAKKIQTSEEQIKFPKKSSLHLGEKRAMALHFFANHELLAIEMMAAALLKFPFLGEAGEDIIRGLLGTIKDEQKHLSLYRQKMNELGLEFGDLPLNDFFWRQFSELKTLDEYFATMSLTFEQANLDFAAYYRDVFFEVDDTQTATIMQIVLDDEIQHVSFGHQNLEKSRIENHSEIKDWDYYLSLLPEKLSPARGKGMQFHSGAREKAGLSQYFIEKMDHYRGDFSITERKEWKSS